VNGENDDPIHATLEANDGCHVDIRCVLSGGNLDLDQLKRMKWN
jgi:hypothetical protein